MRLDLLDTPLRVTWEFCSGEFCLPADKLRHVAGRLTEAGVFFVTLQKGAPRHPATGEIIAMLSAGGVRVSLIAQPAELSLVESNWPLQELFIDAGGWLDGASAQEELGAAAQIGREKGFSPAFLAVPLASRLARLPQLFALCREHDVGRLKLPNISVDGNLGDLERGKLPTAEELFDLRKKIGDAAESRRGLELEVHDLFLWEILSRGDAERGEFGGCQAANSLAHIDAQGDIFPCSSWPLRLGSLCETSLEAIWQNERRYRIRRDIEHLPAGCAGCSDYALCIGGCRGLAVSFSDRDARDPGCAGRR